MARRNAKRTTRECNIRANKYTVDVFFGAGLLQGILQHVSVTYVAIFRDV
jgi:hypothetical protein